MLPLQFCHPGPPFSTLLRPAGHPQNGFKFWLIGRSVKRSDRSSVGQGEVTRMSRCLFSFVTRACPSRPFYALRATPKTALNFGRSVTGKSHELFSFVTRACPSQPFSALRATPTMALNLVGRSIGHREVTQTSRCLFSFVTRARPSRPFYALRETPKTALNFGRSFGRSVSWSVGHREVTGRGLKNDFATRSTKSEAQFYAA
jgi:hypothetical protein